MTSSPPPSRRAVLSGLAGAAAVLVTACTRGSSAPSPTAAPSPAADGDAALRAAAVTREQALLQAYDRALAAAPGSAALLGPLRAEHAEHLAALGVPGPPTGPGPTRTSSGGTSSGGTSSGATSPNGTSPGRTPPGRTSPGRTASPAARAGLAAAERRAAAEHGRDALAGSRDLAVVLATLGASEASHLVALA